MTRFPATFPVSRVPDARQAPALRWGILGTGWIAEKFVGSLLRNTRQTVSAVGSRSIDQARAFADEHGLPRAHGSYEDLVQDPNIDIVYVASPHNFHVEHGLLAIDAGKHVLIEKPIALDSASLERLFAAADARGVMCQEAFWSFFLPKFDVMRQVLDSGVLGELSTILVDFGELLPPTHRIHDPSLAGGALHDLGIYEMALSAWTVGRPSAVVGQATMTASGVVANATGVLRSAAGVITTMSTTMMTATPCRAVIAGSEATLSTDEWFLCPGNLTLTDNRTGQRIDFSEPNIRHEALFWEAAEVARRISAGELTTPYWTRENTRDTTATLDLLNSALGIH